MIVTATFIAISLLQGSQSQGQWALEASAREPGSMIVSGGPELTPGEAYESARDQVTEDLRRYFVEKGHEVVKRSAPAWLPRYVEDRIVGRWISDLDLARAFKILDQEQIDRNHGYSMSYQTRLLIKRDPERLEGGFRSLERRTARQGELFLAKCGGTVLLWAALALCCGWLDRLSRGYMSNRLRLLFFGLGLGLPTIAFFVI